VKFHRLDIENINSLYDEQVIDFEGQLSQTPLFLIMGPTGAGKTTILDCICLALFGTTPRQQHVSSTSDIAEHIMSRGKGEASVTLEFSRRGENGERRRFRAGWYCNRAHRSPSGNMQTPRRSLDILSAESGSWESLTTSTTQKEYDPYFDDALAGMTLQDFLRSVLLAQGAFTAFLEAEPDKKADILEKLTSTEQYMSIGGRAMERWQDVKSSVDEIENKMEGVSPMSDEEFEALEREREELEQETEQAAKQRDACQAKLDWLTRLGELRERIEKAEEELEASRTKREAHDDDFERLALAKRAQPAAKVLVERDRLDSELADLREEVADRNEALEELRPKHEKAQKAVERARKELSAAKTRRSEMSDELDRAKALHTKLEEAETADKEKSEAAAKAKKKVEALEETLEKHKKALADVVEKRDEAANSLDDLSRYAGIGEEFAGLEAGLGSVKTAFEQVESQAKRVDELEEKADETAEALEGVDARLSEAAEGLEPLQKAVEEARDELDARLDGAESVAVRRSELRERSESAREQRLAMQKLAEDVGALRHVRAEVEDRREAVDAAREKLGEARKKRESSSEAVEDAEKDVEARVEVLDARRDAAKFIRERAELEDGESCPLCGSTEHPWAHADDESDAVLQKLEAAEEAMREAKSTRDERKESLREMRETCVRLEQKLQDATGRVEEATKDAEELTLGVRQALESYEIEASVEELEALASAVKARLEEAVEQVESLENEEEALDAADQAHRKAVEALEGAEDRGNELREKKRSLEQTKEAVSEQVEDAQEELGRRGRAFDEAAEELVERFDGVGIEVAVDESERGDMVSALRGALDEAREHRRARAERKTAVETFDEEVEKRKAEIEGIDKNQLPDRREVYEEAKTAADDAAEKVASLREKAESMLDGESPSDVEERLEKAVEEAESAVKEAEAKRDELKEKVNSLETELEGREERRGKLRTKRETVQDALDEKLEELEIEGADALREAMLDDEALAELEETVSEIREALAGAKATLKSAREQMKEHREARPDDLDDDAEVEQLTEKVEALDVRKSKLDQQLGAKREAIKTQKELREKHAKLADELAERRAEFRRWTLIHDLIGRKMGANFKRFAQALNLQRIVHKANEHLEQLHDRYRLAVVKDSEGNPQLEFEVIDTHVSNTARAISTLSGGETFLVSLALALALADFRQVRMPVETLLLDEGFGTLDQQSLDDAVSTLKTLHTREQRQVGVISHVERLQEEIQHRVVVQKLSGGRSEIEVETP
jgi:exonuclease SbcC